MFCKNEQTSVFWLLYSEFYLLVGERSIRCEALAASRCGLNRSENVGLSSANIGENPIPRNPKGSRARLVRSGLVRT